MSFLPIEKSFPNNKSRPTNKAFQNKQQLIATTQINRTGGVMDQSNKPVGDNIKLNSTIAALQQVIAEQAAQLKKVEEQLKK